MRVAAWRWLLVAATLWLALAGPRPAQAADTPQQALFERLDGSRTAVELPDTWALRGEQPTGEGSYVLRFDLPAAATEPWAAYFTRISASRQVWLNGSLIEQPTRHGVRQPHAALLQLPPALLRPGANELRIQVSHQARGGLSTVQFGPHNELQDLANARHLRTQEIPGIANMAVLLQSIFMVLIFLRRRSDVSMFIFGLLTALIAVSNYCRFIPFTTLPAALEEFLSCATQVSIVTMVTALAFGQRRRRLLEDHRSWPVWMPVLLAPPLLAGLLSLWLDWQTVRTWIYPPLALMSACALAWTCQAMRRQREPLHLAILASLAVEIVAIAHDHALDLSLLPVSHDFWLPWAMPAAVTVYALVVLHLLVRGLSESERLNVELEQRVAQRTQALEGANAVKSRFLAAASHDLRQPVAAIGLMAGLLREQLVAPHLRQLGTRIYESVGTLEAMLKGLLDLSRLDADTLHVRRAPVSLQALFDAVAIHEVAAAEARGLRLRLRPTDLVVVSDAVLLEQVLRNLVGNAVRYTERGGVLVAARPAGRRGVRLQVWDTGCGIAPDEQDKIFDEFYQVGNRARGTEHGLGLGLSIVRRAVTRLGHALTLRSEPGRGSCFSLMLPRGVRAAPLPVAQPAQSAQLQGQQVVVVEDNHEVRESLTARLQAWGAEVRAYDGLPAWQLMPGTRPALLIADQRLPTGSGLDVVAWARQHWGTVPALIITGDTAPEDLQRLEAGGVPVLHKPFQAEALLRAIEPLLTPEASAA